MNPSDSKKLEEIERRWKGPLTVDQAPNTATLDIVWLGAKVKEQDREIERLGLIEIQLRNHVQTFQNLAEKAEARVKELEANRSPITVLADTLKARVKKELEAEKEKV